MVRRREDPLGGGVEAFGAPDTKTKTSLQPISSKDSQSGGPGARQGIPRCPRSPSSEASPRAARKDAGATCGEWPPCEGSSRAALRLHRAGYLPAQREKLSENAPFVSLRVPGRSGGQAGR